MMAVPSFESSYINNAITLRNNTEDPTVQLLLVYVLFKNTLNIATVMNE